MQLNWQSTTAAVFLGLTLAIGFSPVSHAQAYPNRPITFVYPYAAGSGPDAAWRAVVHEASQRLGQPIVFVNRPGAGGRLGLDSVLRSSPDGYTLAGAANAVLIVQALVDPKFYIEPGKDYTPVITTMETYLVVAAKANAPFSDLKGLIAYAKANPGKLNAGSAGAGTIGHLGLAMLSAYSGIEYTHVPYKGLAPALAALLAGEIDLLLPDLAARPHIASGKIIGIAVSGAERWVAFPSLPTMQEAGLPRFNASSWHVVVGPAGLPPEIVAALNRAFGDALNSTTVRTVLENGGWAVKGGTPSSAAELIRTDMEVYRPVVKAANIKLD